eukprot:COSAG03_NODE_435_length_7932_cov_6.157283_5_plen_105_part_00
MGPAVPMSGTRHSCPVRFVVPCTVALACAWVRAGRLRPSVVTRSSKKQKAESRNFIDSAFDLSHSLTLPVMHSLSLPVLVLVLRTAYTHALSAADCDEREGRKY